MLSNLMSSINDNIYTYLDDLVFLDTRITKTLTHVIGTNFTSGMLLICNALIYGFMLYYAISYFLSYMTFSQIERPLQFVFKLLLCAFAINGSQAICNGLISLCSQISSIVLKLGHLSSFPVDVSFGSLVGTVLPKEYFTTNSFSLFSFDGLLRGSITFGFLSLTVSYAIRYIILKVLVILSPVAILSLASSKTSWFFKAWLKNFFALLFLQVFVAAILVVCFLIDDKESFMPEQVIHLGMVYTLFKANSLLRDLLGGFSTEVNLSIPNFSSMIK